LGPSDVTALLKAWSDGISVPAISWCRWFTGDFTARAAAYLRREYRSHTLQTTARDRRFAEMKGAMGHDA
jgi:hypothetical protein